MRKVIILRGLPGSGKTTYARSLKPTVIVSADDYFTSLDGIYCFNPVDIGRAHQQCFLAFLEALDETYPLIVADNTNSQRWEVSPYVLAAEAYDYEVEVLTIERPAFATENLPTVHGIPPESIRRMADRWEDGLPHWQTRSIINVERDKAPE